MQHASRAACARAWPIIILQCYSLIACCSNGVRSFTSSSQRCCSRATVHACTHAPPPARPLMYEAGSTAAAAARVHGARRVESGQLRSSDFRSRTHSGVLMLLLLLCVLACCSLLATCIAAPHHAHAAW